MEWLRWLSDLAKDADPSAPGFQPQALYIVVCLVMPVTIGLVCGVGLRVLERVFNIEFGKGGH